MTTKEEKLSKEGWLPIVLCPTDGVDRMLLLPDGKEIIGAYHNGGFGERAGWKTAAPLKVERPVYEETLRGGFIAEPWKHHSTPEPARKQIGTREETIWLMGELPEGTYPTHFRPNDTVYGDGRTALERSGG